MGWQGAIHIPPAQASAGSPANPIGPGQRTAFTILQVPTQGDLPRPNERWYLNSIYLPFSVEAAVAGVTSPATSAAVTLSLTQAGIPAWSQQFVLPLFSPGSGFAWDGVANAQATGDLVNPITLHSGGSPLNIDMAVVLDGNANGVTGYVGQQLNVTNQSPFTLEAGDSPGQVAYQALTIAEVMAGA